MVSNHPTRSHLRFFSPGIILLPLLLFCFATVLPAAEHTGKTTKNIIILHSYHKGFSWTDGIEQGLRDGLSGMPNLRIFTEYLDSKRQSFATAQEPFGRYLRNKYQYMTPDLIIVSDNNALSFLGSQPVETFENVPVIFCGINNFSDTLTQAFAPDITGVVEQVDPAGTVQLIRQLNPDCRRIIVISDATAAGIHIRKLCEKELTQMKLTIPVEWWHGLNREDLEKRLRLLSRDDAVLLTLFKQSPDKRSYSYEESGRFISAASPAPVFGLWDFYLGTGVVGGRMASSRDQGTNAAGMARHFLKNMRLPEPLTSSPNVTLFDGEALSAHNLSNSKLPPDGIIRGSAAESQFPAAAVIAGTFLLGTVIMILLFLMRPLFSKQTELLAIINRRVLGITSSFILCLLLALFIGKYWEYQRFTNKRHQQLLTNKKEALIMMVEQAVNQIQAGRIKSTEPTITLQNKLLQQIDAFSFMDGAGYIFILDYDGTILSHPLHPEMVGTRVDMLQSPDGIYPAREIIRQAKQSDGTFVSHLLPEPGRKQSDRKLTYTMGIPDWRWAVASGLYLDDIDEKLKRESAQQLLFLLQELFFIILTTLFGIGIIFLLCKRLRSQVRRELSSLEQGLTSQNSNSPQLSEKNYRIKEFAHMATGIQNAFSDLDWANQELLTSKQQYIDALHASPNAMLLIDNESFIACNNAAAQMLGYDSSKDLLNLHPRQISPPAQEDGQDSAEKASKIVQATISQGTNKFEWLHLRKDGTVIPIEVTLTLSPITISNTNTVLQCIWRDLTLEKKVATQVQEVEKERLATLEESERMNRLMSGREERILEIKNEVNTLLKELRRSPKYGRNRKQISTFIGKAQKSTVK